MAALKSILVFLLVGYGALVALAYFAQRALMYFPDRTRTPPAQAGLPEAEEVTFESADGEKLVAWYVPSADGKPVVLGHPQLAAHGLILGASGAGKSTTLLAILTDPRSTSSRPINRASPSRTSSASSGSNVLIAATRCS